MATIIKDHDQALEYLVTLGNLAYHPNNPLGTLILAQHQLAEKTGKFGFKTPVLSISDTGFPSLPTLNADLPVLYEHAKKNMDDLERRIDEADSVQPQVMPIVTANPDYLRAFMEYDQKDGYRLRIKEDEDWLVIERFRPNYTSISSTHPLSKNKTEVLALATSVVGAPFFPPLVAVYPMVLALKLGIPNSQRTYFIPDMVRYFRYKGRKDALESDYASDVNVVGSFKFLHPSTTDDLKYPTLIHKSNSGNKKKRELFLILDDKMKVAQVDDLLPELSRIADLLSRGTAKDSIRERALEFLTCDNIDHHLISVIKQQLTWTKIEDSPLVQVDEKSRQHIITSIENIVGGSIRGLDIPNPLYVDAIGNLVPHLNLWCPKEDIDEKLIQLRKDTVDFYSGKIGPIEYLERNIEILTHPERLRSFAVKSKGKKDRSDKIGGLLQGIYFVLYNREQLDLPWPIEGIEPNYDKFKYTLAEILDEKKHDGEKIDLRPLLSKSPSIITPYEINGPLRDLINLGLRGADLNSAKELLKKKPLIDNAALLKVSAQYAAAIAEGTTMFEKDFVPLYNFILHALKKSGITRLRVKND